MKYIETVWDGVLSPCNSRVGFYLRTADVSLISTPHCCTSQQEGVLDNRIRKVPPIGRHSARPAALAITLAPTHKGTKYVAGR
jgi:hypothetical protein